MLARANPRRELRVLSIQSHVVSGYCGNKSAVFPLQLLGFEVDAINSVQLSNHTGYKICKGQVLTDKDLADLAEGLRKNDIDFYSHLLTGYVGSPSFLLEISKLFKTLKLINPKIKYVCDPVMGDNGKMYVPEQLLPIYKEHIVPLADIITPNQFELELLTDRKITTIDEAWVAMDILHERGVTCVVLSSTDFASNDNLIALASNNEVDGKTHMVIEFPKYPHHFIGTGDLFAALLLAWMERNCNEIKSAVEKVIATIQAVLKRTIQYAEGKHFKDKCFGCFMPASIELKLIQSKGEIENPVVTIRSEAV